MHRENEVDEANKLTSNSLEKNKKNTATTRNDLKEQWTKKRSQDRRECLGLFFWPWRPYFIAFLNRLVFPSDIVGPEPCRRAILRGSRRGRIHWPRGAYSKQRVLCTTQATCRILFQPWRGYESKRYFEQQRFDWLGCFQRLEPFPCCWPRFNRRWYVS